MLRQLSMSRSRWALRALPLLWAVCSCGSALAVGRGNKYKVRVTVRMRPLPPDAFTAALQHDQGKRTVLPLHQRLELIRAHAQCNRTDSQRRLWESRGGIADAWAEAEARVPDGKVIDADVDMRNGKEAGGWRGGEEDMATRACVLSTAGGEGGHVLMCGPSGMGIRRFVVDHVLTETSSQEDTYAAAALETVNRFLGGQSACIFAYGQTGSGKSYTMLGASDEAAVSIPGCSAGVCAGAGIVPRVCGKVFEETRALHAQGGQGNVSISIVELYGEDIADLLAPDLHVATPPSPASPTHAPAAPAHRPKRPRILPVAVLRGRYAVRVTSPEECAATLSMGMRARRRATTAMNERSSRAHTVVLLHLATQQHPGATIVQRSLCMVDLGGAEQVSKSILTKAARQFVQTQEVAPRLQEAIYINQALLALKNCVRALVANDPHVPFSDSKLTTILRGALQGSCSSSVLVTCNPHDLHAHETADALRFAEAISGVVFDASAAPPLSQIARDTLRKLDLEIEQVQGAIRSKERWTTSSSLHGAVAGQQSVTRIVGAEEEHAQLQLLMQRRRLLTGGGSSS